MLVATPDSGWVFDRWGGYLSGTENPATVIISEDIIIEANFTEEVSTTSISEGLSDEGIKLYPNPVDACLTIDLSQSDRVFSQAVILNTNGTKLIESSVTTDKVSLDVSDLPSGFYIIYLKGDQMVRSTFIKK